jgi:hypothetical protein
VCLKIATISELPKPGGALPQLKGSPNLDVHAIVLLQGASGKVAKAANTRQTHPVTDFPIVTHGFFWDDRLD